ncbi:hypothetical protein [Dactylosporangium sp. NPDC005555]|uniref:hypothetical protein n=1 Tax=Dactylosporangium sp. NPDC005555 TaxID=3154889 RepID=UPI0033ADB08E
MPRARLLVLAVVAVLALGCGWTAGPPGIVTVDAGYNGVLRGGPDTFRSLVAAADTRPADPAVARLVGPTYGVAFDTLGVARTFDGRVFSQAAYGLHPDDVSRGMRGEHRAADGHEFLLAQVPATGHLPEPEGGYATLFADWQVDVGGTVRPLDGDITVGAIVVVSVPVGADAALGATVDGQSRWIDLRTGRVR